MFPGSCFISMTLKGMYSLMQKSIPPPFLFRSFLTMRQTGIENQLSGKLESSLLSLIARKTRKISKVSFISSFNDSNLFRNEFSLRCPRKTFLGCLLLEPLKVLKISFAFFRLTIVLQNYLFPYKHWQSYSPALYVSSQIYSKQITNFQSACWFRFY